MNTVDFAQLADIIIKAAIAVAIPLCSAWIASHIKDKQAADALNTTLQNGLGAMQQAVQSGISTHPLQLQLPYTTAPMAAGIQYVLDHAPAELARFGITTDMIEQKLSARLGLKNIDTNVATAASPATTPQPLSPIPNPSLPSSKV